tara:strand:+ start:103 stop:756 length:654 start_codon:yes stop_codon:yes gene_type:complete
MKKIKTAVIELEDSYLVITGLRSYSQNSKTGNMLQSYIIDKEKAFSEPKVFGSKCSECPVVKECYVSRDKLTVRRSLKKLVEGEKTSYQFVTLNQVLPLIKGRSFRFGTYGDPSAIPLDMIRSIASVVKSWTGYTHFWREISQEYQEFFMASVEDLTGEMLAQAMNWRTFRMIRKGESNDSINSILCPNTSRGITCEACKLCKGTSSRAKSIWIDEH